MFGEAVVAGSGGMDEAGVAGHAPGMQTARASCGLVVAGGSKLDRLPKWGSDEGSPELEVRVGGETFDWGPSVSVCLAHVGSDPWALLCASEDGSGGLAGANPVSQPSPDALWLILRARDLPGFWRDALLRYQCSESDLRAASPHAFP
jgi:hypothetical protein